MTRPLILAFLLSMASPVIAGAGNFVLVNQSGTGLSDLQIRRSGTSAWTALPNSASQGASTAVKFSNEDCAFDIRAKLADDGLAVWSGVNLCEVDRVTLRRGPGGTTYALYD